MKRARVRKSQSTRRDSSTAKHVPSLAVDPKMVYLSRQRLRLLYALGDFQMALSAADFLAECDSDRKYNRVELRRFRCYETALIMGYTRPFSESRGGKIPRLSIKMTGAELSPEQQHLHENLMLLRNKVIAHSDEEMMRMVSQTRRMRVRKGFDFVFLQTVFDEGLTLVGFTLVEVNTLLHVVFAATYTKLLKDAQLRPTDFNIRLNDRISPRPLTDPLQLSPAPAASAQTQDRGHT